MTRIAIFLIAAFAFFLSGCSTTRKTTATETQAESQLTATTAGQQHTEATGQTAIITNVQTDEKKNVVIDFAKVEFYPGEVPALPSDSTAPDWFNAIVPGGSTDYGTKAKPPNVKSITTGRAVINGEKKESRATEATTQATATEDTAIKADISAAQQEATETKTEEKPKFTFWDWLYIIVVGGFSVYCIIFGVKLIIKMHNTAKKGG